MRNRNRASAYNARPPFSASAVKSQAVVRSVSAVSSKKAMCMLNMTQKISATGQRWGGDRKNSRPNTRLVARNSA